MGDGHRIGAYVLAADPTWIRSSLAHYYDHLDTLVISAARSNRGWTGHAISADECVDLVRSIDTRGIARLALGEWRNVAHPLVGETEQRQAALAELAPHVDWILQIDSDEVLPNFDALRRMLDEADALCIDAVEWPMRVLFRRLSDGRYLQVTSESRSARYEYPGAIAVRPGVTLTEARRTGGRFLRPVVVGDTVSTQLTRPADADEVRLEVLGDKDAILHNSWARSPRAVRAKIASWGHNQGLRSQRYYYQTWLPAPLHWRRMQNFHPLFPELWPRLGCYDEDVDALLHPAER